jgi:signal recognition particle GTPase
MDNEILAEVPAPEQEATAAPEPEVNSPEVSTEQTDQPAEKTYTQAEIDAMIGKRLAREQRKWERDQVAKQAEVQTLRSTPPVADHFNDPEEYAQALALQKATELVAQRDAAKQQAEIMEAYADSEEKVRDKYDDYDQVARNPNVPITEVMAEAIYESDVGPEVAYYLGSNVKEAARISRLSPFMQAKEIGKIEARLASDPPVKKTSNAPAPISPVTARSNGAPSHDTTDPRSIKSMTTSQWIEAERVRQIKKLEAQRNR